MAIVSWDEITNPKPRRTRQEEEEEDQGFSPFSEFAKGLSSGIDQEQALYGAAKAGIGSALGDEELKQEGFDYYRQQMAEAAVNAPTVSWEDDFDSLSDVGNFVAYTLGNSIPSLATTIAGGGVTAAATKFGAKKLAKEKIETAAQKKVTETAQGLKKEIEDASQEKMNEVAEKIVEETVRDRLQNAYRQQALNKYAQVGGVVGAAVPGTGMAFGENFARIYEETGLEDPGTALVSGIVSGSLDAFGAPFKAIKSMFPDNPQILTDLKQYIADKALTTTGRTRLGNMLTEGIKVAGWEGATEATQEFLSRSAVMWAKENLEEEQQALFNGYLYNEEAFSSYMHAFVAGSIAGQAVGLGTGAFKAVENPDGTQQLDVKREKQRQEKQVEAKQAVSDAYEAETEDINDFPLFPDAVNVLEVIRSTGKTSKDELVRQTGLKPDRVQESLDVLVDREDIIREITEQGVSYQPVAEQAPTTAPETVAEDSPVVVQDAPQDVEPEAVTEPVVAEQSLSALEEAALEGSQTDATDRMLPERRNVDFGDVRERLKDRTLFDPLDGTVSTETSIEAADERIQALNENVGNEAPQIGGNETFVTQQVPQVPSLLNLLVDDESPSRNPRMETEPGSVFTLSKLETHFLDIEEESGGFAAEGLVDPDTAVGRIAHTLIDLIERGMPTDAVRDLNGVHVIPEQAEEAGVGAHFASLNTIAAGESLIQSAINGDQADLNYMTQVIAHELWHSQDAKKGYTKQLSTLQLKAVNVDAEGNLDTTAGSSIALDMGDVVAELYDLWESNSDFGKFFNYPFAYLAEYIDAEQKLDGVDPNFDKIAGTMSREVFAQLGSAFISQPKLVQQFAPKAYRLMKSIQQDPRPVTEVIDSANPNNQEERSDADDGQVLRDVRAPPTPRGVQIPDEGRAGEDGVGRDQRGTADTGVERSTDSEVRDGSGRDLRERLDQAQFTSEPSPEEDAPTQVEVSDDFDAIVEEKKYLYQKSKGNVRGKFAITKKIGPKNANKQLPALRELSSRHQSALDSPASWLRFERDLTGSNETLRPPHGLIRLYNNPEEWASVHGKLGDEQLAAARAGLDTAKELGDLYEQGVVTPDITAKLMLWGMMSRMLTASSQEAGFVDLVFSAPQQNRSTFEDFADTALSGEFTDADVQDWKEFVPTAITEGSFGRGGTSNANDFGRFLQKMSEMDESGVTKLQKLHDLIADRSIPSTEVRRQFQGMADNIGIDNKVFSFLLLMTGRDDVVILDRIQLNTMWDSGRYGKLIYDDIAENFNGLHGLARYEALESALSSKIQDLYTAIGRPDEASVGRYHWESWVLNSGQVVAHPTMQGIVNDVRGDESPYANLGAPEGKQNMFRYGSIYARDADGEQYFLYPDSTGKVYRLTKQGFADFIEEIRKAKSGILPKGFKVSEYDKGFPWYEAEGVNRENLDRLLRSYAEREATQVERSFEETIQDGDTDGSRQGELDPQTDSAADDFDAIMDPAFSQASRFVETRNKLADEINEAGFPELVSEIDPTDLESLSPASRNLIRALERDDYLGFDRIDDLLLTIFDEGLDGYDVSQGTKTALGRYVNEVGGADNPDSFDYFPNLFDTKAQEVKPFKLTDEIITESSVEKKIRSIVPRYVRQKVVDRLERLKEAEDQIAQQLGLERLPAEMSAYDAENLMHSKAQRQLEEFEEESLEPIIEEIKKAGLDINQVGAFLLAKHAPERNAVIAQKEVEMREAKIASMQQDIDEATEKGETTERLMEELAELEARPLRHQETGSGITDDQAKEILLAANEAGKTDTLEAVASKVYSMLEDMRQNMVDKGLLDEDTRADWESTYKFYVPLKGFASYPEGLDMKTGSRTSGFSVRGSESFRAKGRITLPVNPLLVAFKDVEDKIIRAERNVIAQRLLTLLSNNKSEDNWKIYNNRKRAKFLYGDKEGETMSLDQMRNASRPDDGISRFIQVKRGGTTFFIEIKDQELNRQLQSGGVGMFNNNVDVMNSFMTVLTKFQNFRRNMLINYNPSWGLVNPIRDVQTGLAFALSEQDVAGGRIQGKELIGKIAVNAFASYRAFWRQRRGTQGKNEKDLEYDQYAAEYVEDGAPTGLAMSRSLQEQSRRFEKIINQGDLKKKLRAVGDWVEDYNQSMENAVRLSTYIEARKAGVERENAATLAKDLTVNFNRKGELSSGIDALYLFFNAAVQGNVNIAKAILRPGKDGQTITKARALAASIVALGFARTLMNIGAAGEDDDGESKYADFNEYALKTSMVVVNPFDFTEGQSYAIPMPYGYGIFDNIGRYGAELATGIKTPEEVAIDFLSSVDHHFNPMSLHASKDGAGLADAALQKGIGFAPDIGAHAVEQLANINFFGSDIKIPQNSFLVEKPASEPTKRRTSEHITAVTRWVNSVTGGTSNVPGAVSMNPEQVQHLIEFLLGGVGRFFDDSADTIGKLVSEDPDLRSTDLPILRTFLPLPSEYSDRMDYYANRTKVRQYAEDYKAAESRQDQLAVNKRAGFNVSEFRLFDRRIEKDLRKIFDRKKRLESTNVDPVMRIEQLQKLSEAEERLFDTFNKRFREATK